MKGKQTVRDTKKGFTNIEMLRLTEKREKWEWEKAYEHATKMRETMLSFHNIRQKMTKEKGWN